MIRNILLSAQSPSAASDLTAIETASWAIYGVGLVVLIVWLIRIRGRDPLAHCPVRRHRLPAWFVPSQILIWIIGNSLLYAIAQTLFKDTAGWKFQVAVNLETVLWYIMLLCLFLPVVRFGFARGLRGFGLDRRTAGRDLWTGLLTLLAVLPLIYGSIAIVTLIGEWLNPEFKMQQHAALTALEQFPQWWTRMVIILNTVLIGPVFEEVLFRGLLQSALTAQLRRPWLSILITSLLFASFHPYITQWAALFILSVALGYAYEKSGSLLRPIFMHIFFNGLNITFTLLAS